MVKKIILFIFLSMIVSNHSLLSYYQLDKNNKIIENKLNYAVSKNLKGKNLEYRNNFRKKLDMISLVEKKYFYLIQNVKKQNGLYDYNIDQTKDFEKININNKKIQESWLSFHNHERKNLGLQEYKINTNLSSTSYEWSKNQSKLGEMTHKRKSTDIFYNHKNIESWFADRGISCRAKGGVTITESIAKYSFKCVDNECSDELTDSIRTIFNIYMDEKGLKYPNNAHYKAIVHPELEYIGLGIKIINKNNNYYDYYLTSHYCSELIN